MNVIKYLGQGENKFEILVHTYSLEEWRSIKTRNPGWIAFYDPEDTSIHILQKEDYPTNIWRQGIVSTWEATLMHEYIHYLQHMKSCWDEMIPIDPKGKGIPKIKAFKEAYPEELWEVEAEAYWYMYRPRELGLYLVPA